MKKDFLKKQKKNNFFLSSSQKKIKKEKIEKLENISEKIFDAFHEDFRSIFDLITNQLPETHPIKKYLKINEISEEQLLKEISLENGIFETENIGENSKKVYKNLQELERIVNLKKQEFDLNKKEPEILAELNLIMENHKKNVIFKILCNFEIDHLLKILKKSLIKTYYEDSLKKEDGDLENNYEKTLPIQIKFTPVAIKIGEEILNWFLFRILKKKNSSFFGKGLLKKGNLNFCEGDFSPSAEKKVIKIENKWSKGGDFVKINLKNIFQWSKNNGGGGEEAHFSHESLFGGGDFFKSEGGGEENIGIKFKLGIFILYYFSTCTDLFFIKEDVLKREKIKPKIQKTERRINLAKKFFFLTNIQAFFFGMCIPPIPWDNRHEFGGYICNNLGFLIRINFTKNNFAFLEKYVKKEKIYKNNIPNNYYSSVNKLQEVPFKINLEVFQILNNFLIKEIKKNKEGGKGLHFMWELEFKKNKEGGGDSFLENLTEKSFQRFFLIKMIFSMASTYIYSPFFKNRFFIPQVIEKRGRIYALSNLISFYNHSLARSLILFFHSEKIGTQKALIFLISQGSGLFLKAFEKETIKNKFNWWQENEFKFFYKNLKNGESELTEEWKNAYAPFEFLSWLTEIKNLNNLPPGVNKLDFESFFCLGQDCTSSVFQIYSLLLSDLNLARLTNIINWPSLERPNDIYSKFQKQLVEFSSKFFNDFVKKEEISTKMDLLELEIFEKFIKKLNNISFENLFDRKFSKEILMQKGYGLTELGLKRLVKKNLLDKEIIKKEDSTFFFNSINSTSQKISGGDIQKKAKNKLVFIFCKIINNTFLTFYSPLEKFMLFLKDFSFLITKNKLPLVVEIPSENYFLESVGGGEEETLEKDNFIFLQLYPKMKKEKVCLRLKNLNFLKRKELVYQKPYKNSEIIIDSLSNSRAAPPNIIHAFDANLLMRIIHSIINIEKRLNCKINFTSVHDKFICSPRFASIINFVVRKNYFKLAKILENWIEQFLIPINLKNLKENISEKEFKKIHEKVVNDWADIKFSSEKKEEKIDKNLILKSKNIIY
jgi:hypothetical protein